MDGIAGQAFWSWDMEGISVQVYPYMVRLVAENVGAVIEYMGVLKSRDILNIHHQIYWMRLRQIHCHTIY